MTETTPSTPSPAAAQPGNSEPPAPAAQPAKKEKEEGNFFVFLVKLIVIMLAFRTLAFAPFNIPSESMLPGLQNGDYLLASKWNYGFSNNSLPFGFRPFPEGRILASQPQRGDVVIFKAPPLNSEDYIKRVIGLPGDQIQMIGGVLHINGIAVKKQRIADFELPISPNTRCFSAQFAATNKDGLPICAYPQFRETLPNGVSYNVLDYGQTPQDDTPAVVVPDGMLFMMGDNRDNSLDSRFPAVPGQGVGLVPQDNLVGKASIMMWSTDGSSSWLLPWTWFTAARWERIGERF